MEVIMKDNHTYYKYSFLTDIFRFIKVHPKDKAQQFKDILEYDCFILDDAGRVVDYDTIIKIKGV